MIPEHPGKDSGEFLEWVNTVLDHRHGRLRRLEKIKVFEQKWTTQELARVKRMNKIYFEPRKPEEPVIVLRGLSKDYLLDGNRRINTWIRDDNKDLHPVWLVCPDYE